MAFELGTEQVYLGIYDRVFARPRLVIALVVGVAAGAATLAPRIGMDMSFRPLFGQSEADLEATRAFEERFGQRSGAYIGAVVTPRDWTPSLLEGISAATRDVEGIDHVSEVVSVARFASVAWTPEGPLTGWLLPAGTLDSVSAAELDAVRVLRNADDLRRVLFSEDGRRTVVLARLDLPLEDLGRRATVIRAFQASLKGRLEGHAELSWVGISVVEDAYSRLVLRGITLSLVLTTLTLLIALGLMFRRAAAVAAIMAGVTLALPAALAAMVLRDQAITIVNSMVPTMIMVIGVADAIHMLECYSSHVRGGTPGRDAVRAMFGEMALPCLLTTLTTVAGFLALETARIAAIRDFGLNVAVGVVAVYVANLLVLPALLLILPERCLAGGRPRSSWLAAWKRATARLVTARPAAVVATSAGLMLLCAAGVTRLDVDQRFNEDVAKDHPVRVAQTLFEQEFTGILGPDVTIRRVDGAPVVRSRDRPRLAAFVEALDSLPGVVHSASVLDLVPEDEDDARVLAGLASLRKDSHVGLRARELVSEDGRQVAIALGVADIGSTEASALVDRIRRAAEPSLGPEYEVAVVGQWWLAQLGLTSILRDMLVSFATSFALVLPLVAASLGGGRLFLIGLAPNLIPTIFALGFMGWMGISARVGTAMILAIALAIAVDDTIHILARIKAARRAQPDPAEQVRSAIEQSGSALLLTTLVLAAGFLSMRTNGLLALQDMGLVAAATLTVALLADVYLLPASYVLLERHAAGRPT